MIFLPFSILYFSYYLFSVTPEPSLILVSFKKIFIDYWIQGIDDCSKISIASSYSLLTSIHKSECDITKQTKGEELEQELEEFEQKELKYYEPEEEKPEAKLEEQDPLAENRAADEGCRVVVRCVKCHKGEWFL